MALRVVQGTATVTTAGTAVQLSATATSITSILIQAESGNTNNIYFGDSTVDSNNGFVIAPSCELNLSGDDIRGITEGMILSDMYIDADTDANAVRFLVFRRR